MAADFDLSAIAQYLTTASNSGVHMSLVAGRCSLYVLLTIFTPPDSQDFALLGSWL